MLRKLIFLAITSGLAKKAWEHYRARPTTAAKPTYTPYAGPGATQHASETADHTRATTAGVGAL